MAQVKKEVGMATGSEQRQVAIPDREIGRIQREQTERKFSIAVDQVTGMSKWLTASLFAANSGGLLTVLNTADKLTTPHCPSALFATGLVFALISGTALQEIYNQMSEPLGDLIVFWAEVEAGSRIDVDRQNEIIGRLTSVSKWGWTAPIPGWISGLLFVAAAFAVSFGFK